MAGGGYTRKLPKIHQADIEKAIGPLRSYIGRSHDASVALVQSGYFDWSRVVRGTCRGVETVRHSWVMPVQDAPDVYDLNTTIVDLSLWTYLHEVPGLWVGNGKSRYQHRPLGFGSIREEWDNGKKRPTHHGGPTIDLWLERYALGEVFLRQEIGPLDVQGWQELLNAPMMGWPAYDVISAMYDHPLLRPLISVEIAGMLTDRLPEWHRNKAKNPRR